MSASVQSTPIRPADGRGSAGSRQLGVSTDDAAIFIEDTMDKTTAQCIMASSSAVAILSPQRMPLNSHHVDITEYDVENIGRLSGSKKSHSAHALADVTNTTNCRLSFGKSPTPKATRLSTSHHAASHNSSMTRSVHRDAESPNPVPTVTLSELEAVERDRNRYQKMYEHQKALYEDMSEKYTETYNNMQDKIIEVVALSTRNEESKRFIRQLKKEMSESRTRVMDIQNRALEKARQDTSLKEHYEQLLNEKEEKCDRMFDRYESKLAGLESLLKDVTAMKCEADRLHVSQLDSLLKASYAKNTALFSDMLRQGRQINLLYDSKAAVEKELEQARKDKKDMELTLMEERRRMMAETERFVDQIEEQQHSIINLRQMLIRTMECGVGEESLSEVSFSQDEEEGEDDDDNTGSGEDVEAEDESGQPPKRSDENTPPPPSAKTARGESTSSSALISNIVFSRTSTSVLKPNAAVSASDAKAVEKTRPLLSALIRSRALESGEEPTAAGATAFTESCPIPRPTPKEVSATSSLGALGAPPREQPSQPPVVISARRRSSTLCDVVKRNNLGDSTNIITAAMHRHEGADPLAPTSAKATPSATPTCMKVKGNVDVTKGKDSVRRHTRLAEPPKTENKENKENKENTHSRPMKDMEQRRKSPTPSSAHEVMEIKSKSASEHHRHGSAVRKVVKRPSTDDDENDDDPRLMVLHNEKTNCSTSVSALRRPSTPPPKTSEQKRKEVAK